MTHGTENCCACAAEVRAPRKILIVVDMQYDFIDGALANKDAQKIVKPIADFIKENSFDQIIFTRDTHGKDYLNTPEGKKLPVTHCLEGTKGWVVHEDILNAAIDSDTPYYFVDKPTFGYRGWLWGADFMYDHDEITVVGTCTDICVVSNVLILKAAFPEARIEVVGDLCAGLTPEKHKAALDVMESCQVDVVYTKPQDE